MLQNIAAEKIVLADPEGGDETQVLLVQNTAAIRWWRVWFDDVDIDRGIFYQQRGETAKSPTVVRHSRRLRALRDIIYQPIPPGFASTSRDRIRLRSSRLPPEPCPKPLIA